MGIPLKVTVPRIGGPLLSVAREPSSAWAAWEQDLARARAQHHYLVSLFRPDAPGLLRSMTELLSKGVAAPRAPQDRLAFTIDGSLAASIHGTFSTVLIVRPVGPTG